MAAFVTAVSRSATHTLSKSTTRSIQLVAGLGVEGDADSVSICWGCPPARAFISERRRSSK
jgi:hypothetical protein